MKTTKTNKAMIQELVFGGLFAAIIAVTAQIHFPLPSGIPVTLQTFGIALTGAFLGWKWGSISTAVYLALGAVGVPVFAGFTGGFWKLTGITGGYLWGFLLLAVCCGLGMKQKQWYLEILFGCMGLLLCHAAGVAQFTAISGGTIWNAMLTASVPYLLKDVVSVVLAQQLAKVLRKRIHAVQQTTAS